MTNVIQFIAIEVINHRRCDDADFIFGHWDLGFGIFDRLNRFC